jgi:hypothetical protein
MNSSTYLVKLMLEDIIKKTNLKILKKFSKSFKVKVKNTITSDIHF